MVINQSWYETHIILLAPSVICRSVGDIQSALPQDSQMYAMTWRPGHTENKRWIRIAPYTHFCTVIASHNLKFWLEWGKVEVVFPTFQLEGHSNHPHSCSHLLPPPTSLPLIMFNPINSWLSILLTLLYKVIDRLDTFWSTVRIINPQLGSSTSIWFVHQRNSMI